MPQMTVDENDTPINVCITLKEEDIVVYISAKLPPSVCNKIMQCEEIFHLHINTTCINFIPRACAVFKIERAN